VSLVGEWRIWGGQARFAARLTSRTRSEYDFLLGRFSSFPARRHVESFPRLGAALADGLGSLQRHGWPFWLIAWFDLSAGYFASMGLGLLAVQRRGYRALLWHIPLMPLYWLVISAAAYRALWQFITARFEWEKTEHGLSPRGEQSARGA